MTSRGNRLRSWKKRMRRARAAWEGKKGVTGMVVGASVDEKPAENPQRVGDDLG